MTTTAPLHMYAEPAIRFRDPFRVSKKLTSPASNKSFHQLSQRPPFQSTFSGPRTPPPEMNAASSSFRSEYQPQEHAQSYGGHMSSQHPQRAHVPAYPSADVTVHSHDYSRPLPQSTSNGRSSPARPVFIEERRRSNANAIASNFQIPRDVNDSGGSLAELAAQVSFAINTGSRGPILTVCRSHAYSGSNRRKSFSRLQILQSRFIPRGLFRQMRSQPLDSENGSQRYSQQLVWHRTLCFLRSSSFTDSRSRILQYAASPGVSTGCLPWH
jgi:hypothetical protein